MTLERIFVVAAIALGACTSTGTTTTSETTSGAEVSESTSSESEVEVASSEGEGEVASSESSEEPEPESPPDLSSFPEPVRARLSGFTSLPVSPDTPVLSLTLFDASLICGFLDEHVRHEGPVQSACPDGSPVILGGECNPASVLALRRTFGEACELRFGDYLACEIAARASPCSVGFMRADLPECDAVNACLATQVPAD